MNVCWWWVGHRHVTVTGSGVCGGVGEEAFSGGRACFADAAATYVVPAAVRVVVRFAYHTAVLPLVVRWLLFFCVLVVMMFGGCVSATRVSLLSFFEFCTRETSRVCTENRRFAIFAVALLSRYFLRCEGGRENRG